MNETKARAKFEARAIQMDRLRWGLEQMLVASPREIERIGRVYDNETAVRMVRSNERLMGRLRGRRVVRRPRYTGYRPQVARV
ncbi:hypothetical protein [Micromonospora sp. RTGN7]|uniref:hypothetical protein n=1 Tax=Micromonospora sp. RTGN7 TaxID=3016526 RepID=UPI0029FF521A|nr:hypothetical protein [Micromonospora sp. RTGN7]